MQAESPTQLLQQSRIAALAFNNNWHAGAPGRVYSANRKRRKAPGDGVSEEHTQRDRIGHGKQIALLKKLPIVAVAQSPLL